MSIYRRAAKSDANQPEIVQALRDYGCAVWIIRQPVDLLVRTKGGWLPIEVKDGAKAKSAQALKPSQAEFIANAGNCPVAVVNDVESAIRAVRVMESGNRG